MLRVIKKKILKVIDNRIRAASQWTVSREENPYGIHFGENSRILSPSQIDGGNNIFIGKGTFIGRGIWLSAYKSYGNQVFQPEILIGENVNIGNFACITAVDKIEIGDGCLLSEYVYISDHSHGFDPLGTIPLKQDLNSKGTVAIGANSFLGFRVCILPGVKIGKNCVVGSNSVVTKSFPDNYMIAGVPAKAIKKYDFKLNEWVKLV